RRSASGSPAEVNQRAATTSSTVARANRSSTWARPRRCAVLNPCRRSSSSDSSDTRSPETWLAAGCSAGPSISSQARNRWAPSAWSSRLRPSLISAAAALRPRSRTESSRPDRRATSRSPPGPDSASTRPSRSITLTDFVQFIVKTIGIFFILLPLALYKTGGMSGLAEKLPADATSLTAIGGEKILTYFVIYTFGLLIGQDI